MTNQQEGLPQTHYLGAKKIDPRMLLATFAHQRQPLRSPAGEVSLAPSAQGPLRGPGPAAQRTDPFREQRKNCFNLHETRAEVEIQALEFFIVHALEEATFHDMVQHFGVGLVSLQKLFRKASGLLRQVRHLRSHFGSSLLAPTASASPALSCLPAWAMRGRGRSGPKPRSSLSRVRAGAS